MPGRYQIILPFGPTEAWGSVFCLLSEPKQQPHCLLGLELQRAAPQMPHRIPAAAPRAPRYLLLVKIHRRRQPHTWMQGWRGRL